MLCVLTLHSGLWHPERAVLQVRVEWEAAWKSQGHSASRLAHVHNPRLLWPVQYPLLNPLFFIYVCVLYSTFIWMCHTSYEHLQLKVLVSGFIGLLNHTLRHNWNPRITLFTPFHLSASGLSVELNVASVRARGSNCVWFTTKLQKHVVFVCRALAKQMTIKTWLSSM